MECGSMHSATEMENKKMVQGMGRLYQNTIFRDARKGTKHNKSSI
jgi:ribosome maturation protein Sdo1